MSNQVMRLAKRRSILIRHHGADSPEAVAADRAWRRAKVRAAIAAYGDPDDPVVIFLAGSAPSS